MEVKDEAKILFEKINIYSGNRIKNNHDVSAIIQIALNSESADRFNELIFEAKYINGLKGVLANRVVTENNFMEKIFNEFNKKLQAFSSLLKTYTDDCDKDTLQHFDEKYFRMNHESIVNSMGLIGDLAVCKEYFNSNPDELLK